MNNIYIAVYGLCPDEKLKDLLDDIKSICDKTPRCEIISSETKKAKASDYDKLYNFKIDIRFENDPPLFNSKLTIEHIKHICGKYLIGIRYFYM